jgi:hypothetical protein
MEARRPVSRLRRSSGIKKAPLESERVLRYKGCMNDVIPDVAR